MKMLGRNHHHHHPSEEPSSSSSTLVSKSLGNLIRRVGQVSDNSPQTRERVSQMTDYFIRLLGSRINPVADRNETVIFGLIDKKLRVLDPTGAKSVRFATLFSKLSNLTVIKRKWAILYFLYKTMDSESDVDKLGDRLFKTLAPASKPIQVQVEPPVEKHKVSVLSKYYFPETNNGTAISESQLIRDVMYVLQGHDTNSIRYVPESDYFCLDSNLDVSTPVRELVHKIVEVGWLHRKISIGLNTHRGDFGKHSLFRQSLVAALEDELSDFSRMVVEMESHIHAQTDPMNKLSLKHILIWLYSPLQRMRMMSVILDICSEQKGGQLISVLNTYVAHGDPFVSDFMKKLIEKTSGLLYSMIQSWIFEGELSDPFEEFFVVVKPDTDLESLWRSKYTLCSEMIPSIFDKPLAKKMYLIGKSINFIRHGCHDPSFSVTLAPHVISQKEGELEKLVDQLYQTCNASLLSHFTEKYHIMDHLQALKKYVLLTQGDFAQNLIEHMSDILSRPASTMYKHNLSELLETTIRSSNARFEKDDIVNRLDVRLYESSRDELGWDTFTLDYQLDAPLNAVITPQAMNVYHKLFAFLWKLNRAEYILSKSWTRQMSLYQIKTSFMLHKCHLIRHEMGHFLNQLQHYFFVEVIETAWIEFSRFFESSHPDLDGLIAAHNKYLNQIMLKGCFVTQSNVQLSTKLGKIFDTILEFEKQEVEIVNCLEVISQSEAETAKQGNRAFWESKLGLNAMTVSLPDQPALALKMNKAMDAIGVISSQFRDEFKDLVHLLHQNDGHSLVPLATRLNFNDVF